MAKKKEFDREQIKKVLPHVQEAAKALLTLWDQLRVVERQLNIEINTTDLGDLCGGIDYPDVVLDQLDEQTVFDWLEDLAKDG